MWEGSHQSHFGKCSVAAGLFLCRSVHISPWSALPPSHRPVCTTSHWIRTPYPKATRRHPSSYSGPVPSELLAPRLLGDFTDVRRKKNPREMCRGQKTLLTGSHTSFSISELECRCERAAIIGMVW